MPGRPFAPSALATEELRKIVAACRESEDTLANKHGDVFMLWGRASRDGNQTLCDQFEKECISIRRRQTMNTNKLYKAQNELCRRECQEIAARYRR
jgi:hypothetical protein